jgi:membrane protease YdiL (CAAX protease family)
MQHLKLRELGITRDRSIASIVWGLVAAAAASGLVLGLLLWGPGVGGSVRYTPFSSMTVGTVIARALIWMPLTTALPEELAFRGVLLGLFRQRYAPTWAAILSAIVFAFWHGLTVFHTVGNTSLAQSGLGYVLGCVGGFTAVFIGGLLFALLRTRTCNLAASVIAHWAFNATILVGLYIASGR